MNATRFAILVLLILAAGVSAYLYSKSRNKVESSFVPLPVPGSVRDDYKYADDQETISKEKSAIDIPLDVSSWKTYRNEEYGFEVKFDPRFSPVSENSDVVRFAGPQEEIVYSIYVLEKINPRISHFLSNPECYEGISSKIFNFRDWIVSWFKCGYASDSDHVVASYLDIQRGLVFEIHLSRESNELGMQEIDDILSLFKFIE